MYISASISIVGKTNVGKSTLLNKILNKKLAIVSDKPQTTVYSVKGVAKIGSRCILCVDTPGVHSWIHQDRNKQMNRSAKFGIVSHDLVLALFKAGSWDKDDDLILEWLTYTEVPKVAVITQVDLVSDEVLYDMAKKLQEHNFVSIVPISALKNKHIDILYASILAVLPEDEKNYGYDDEISSEHNHSYEFLAQEMIREQLMNRLREEIPYKTQIEVFKLDITDEKVIIYANLVVHKFSHKKVIVGAGGSMIKSIGMASRKRLAELLGKGVELRLWVAFKKEEREVNGFIE